MSRLKNAAAPTPPAPPLRVLHVVPSFYPAHGYGGPISALYELCLQQVDVYKRQITAWLNSRRFSGVARSASVSYTHLQSG